jgi:hypothetical protein
MQCARAFHPAQLGFYLGETLVDHTAVCFELSFARTAEKTKAAALTLKMGPGSNQAAFLIGQVRVFDL